MTKKLGSTALQLDTQAIILAGDIGPEIRKVLSPLSNLRIPVYAVLGNDDSSSDAYLLEGIPYVLNIDGELIDVGPMEIIGLSGIYCRGMSPPDEKKIWATLEEAFQKSTKPVILVTHLPPYKVLDYATRHGAGHIGSKAVRRIIEKYGPTVCLCGHVHKDGGKKAHLNKTVVINIAALEDNQVSKSQGRRFAIIDVDEKRRCTVAFDYLIDVNLPLEKFVQKYV